MYLRAYCTVPYRSNELLESDRPTAKKNNKKLNNIIIRHHVAKKILGF